MYDLYCNLCGSSSFDSLIKFQDYNTSILLCKKCGLMVNYPFPDQNEIFKRYQETFYSQEGRRFLGWAESLSRFFRSRRALSLYKLFGSRQTILDIGCGRGIVLYELKRRGWFVTGTQISDTAVTYIRKTFGINCFKGDLPIAPFQQNFFDLVTMWHVLEHLRDPLSYLRYCRRFLKPEGYLLLEVPNANSWSARISKDAWMGWDPLHHLHHFTPATLDLALKKSGFIPLTWKSFSWEYSPFTTLQSLLNLFMKRNALFDALKIQHLEELPSKKSGMEDLLIFGLALFLAAPALFISLFSATCTCGEIIRVLAKAGKC